MRFLIVFLVLALSATALASLEGASPIRYSNEHYEAARDRNLLNKSFRVSFPDITSENINRTPTAEQAKRPLKNLDLNEIPNVGSYADLENEFKYIRDTRFITAYDPRFPRRLTWLYPDDGCYARAEMAKVALVDHHFPAPKKIFVFGDLRAQSKNSPTGSVTWWYHVAVTYRVGQQVYILDPALEPYRLLTLSEWNRLVGGNQTRLQYSICSQAAYDPASNCSSSKPLSLEKALEEQIEFLEYEWDRLLELNRIPEEELGNLPPWLQN